MIMSDCHDGRPARVVRTVLRTHGAGVPGRQLETSMVTLLTVVTMGLLFGAPMLYVLLCLLNLDVG